MPLQKSSIDDLVPQNHGQTNSSA